MAGEEVAGDNKSLVELRSARVTVGIPAFNAQSTLDDTIRSVRNQSYAELEIFVVDDGSSDLTPEIARRHSLQDPRITVIRKRNGGVAAARNAALERATGTYFACIDADDLWHPDKIQLQVASLEGREDAILCYTWFALIDRDKRVMWTVESCEEGNVIARMCRGNFVGNGSTPLIRTNALRQIGGWDPNPRIDGCEDYKAYFSLAERGHFAVVKQSLVGYRLGVASKSSKVKKMLMCYDQVVAEFRSRYPEHAKEFFDGRGEYLQSCFTRSIVDRSWSAAAYLLKEAMRHDRSIARDMISRFPRLAGHVVARVPIRDLLKSPIRRSWSELVGRQSDLTTPAKQA